ncbi:hypothetical protein ACTJKH_07360 [Microbacterium sp. 22215]|uniref:hypothetical protein n=1 Tax=Microbacterium sp. 22215 TaxID=3453893 RepID=UPI003F857363
MAIYWVNYDLNRPGQNYDTLITFLQSHAKWAKPLKSSFFVKSNSTAVDLVKDIRKHIDPNDTVVVVDVEGQEWASVGLSAKLIQWLRSNL